MRVREATITYSTTNRPGLERQITCSGNIVELVVPWVYGRMKEYFFVILLDTKHRYVCHEVVSMGNLDSSIVHPRECFTLAVRKQAAAVVFVHNHPSNDPTPSNEDKAITARLVKAGEILGIDVLDHVIVTDDHSFSFRDSGEM